MTAAFVDFYAETGMPHVSVRVTPLDPAGRPLAGLTEGLGFGPEKTAPVGRGDPDHNTRDKAAPDYLRMVRFRLPLAAAAHAAAVTRREFAHKAYVLLARDCVSFARMFAQKCGLRVPIRGATYWPPSFVKYLRDKNSERVVEYHDVRLKARPPALPGGRD
ncbi:MAG TPA: hypothetical protein VH092_19015 [Urbifossiella sp.]|jgi:hypothetical protein|nr:hypothetical protein [Urbifossiella sp.]